MDDLIEVATLGDITDQQLHRLYTTLWGREDNRHVERLNPFQAFYTTLTARYLPEFVASGEVALRNHDEVIDIAQHLKERAGVPRVQVMETYFAHRAEKDGSREKPSETDQARAFDLAARILTMVNCSAEKQMGVLLEDGKRPMSWANSDSLVTFITKTFPTTDHPSLNDPYQAEQANKLKASLRGRRLTKMAGLSFVPTDNLARHLCLDADKGQVEIFHHTRVLKEHLIATRRTKDAQEASKESDE